MRDFAAIDFETANNARTSVCSVGVVIVRDGQIISREYRLIRPYPNYYSRWNTAIHGLTRADTDPAPHFPEVWAEIAPMVEEMMKLLPLAFYLLVFEPESGKIKPYSNTTAWSTPTTVSSAPAAPRAATSGAPCPTTSSTPWPRPAATTSGNTTTLWPMPRRVPSLP